jgi:hypothetical protein
MGIFNRLNDKLGDIPEGEGVSPITIGTLPPAQKRIVRLLLREMEMPYKALVEEMAGSDPPVVGDELDNALKELALDGWLIRMGEGERVQYAVNMRRRAPSQMAHALWSTLNNKIAQAKETED